jgi:hypothetical protein
MVGAVAELYDLQIPIEQLPALPTHVDAAVERSWSDPDYVYWYDGSATTYTDYTSEATEDTADDFPLGDQTIDYIYIGATGTFDDVRINCSTAGTGSTSALLVQYWNGSTWTTLANSVNMYDTDLNTFKSVKDAVLMLQVPDDWATTTVDGQSAYWIRIRPNVNYTGLPLGQRIYMLKDSQAFSDTLTDTITLSDVNQVANAYSLTAGTVDSGTLSDTYTQDGTDFVINESAGTPGTQIEFTFPCNGVARTFTIYGRYQGNPAHTVIVEGYNGVGYDTLAGGNWSHATSDHLQTWTLLPTHTIGGVVKVRITHQSPGNPTHNFYFDHVYIVDGADSLSGVLTRSYTLTDGISLADALSAAAQIAIADSIGLADNLLQGTSYNLADAVTLTDLIAANAAKTLGDTLNLTDKLGIGLNLGDLLTLSDDLTAIATTIATDAMAMTDAISGVLAPGIITPGEGEVALTPITTRRQPTQWDKVVGNQATPISAFVRSSTNTTYTSTTVTDASAWNLGDAKQGDVAITTEGYIGRILAVDNPGNNITVDAWHAPTSLQGLATEKPTDGTAVELHKVVAARRVLITSDENNDNTIYLGTDEDMTPDTGHPFSNDPRNRNYHITLYSPNISKLWAICGSDQTLHISTEGEHPRVQGGANNSYIQEQITLTDELTVAASVVKEDSVALADNLTGVLYPGGGPILQALPTELDYWYDETSLNVTITNIGTGTLTWGLSGVPAYLTPSVASGSLGTGLSQVVSFAADRSGLSEGDRLADSFTVTSNGGSQVVTTNIIKVYSLTCAEVEALSEGAVGITLQPADAATRGNATFDPSVSTTAKFVPERGGWNISISGTDDTIVALVAVQNKKWLPFVSGDPFNLTEQTSYDVYIEGVLRNVMNQGETYYAQYAYRSGAWEYMTDSTGICGQVILGSVSLASSDSLTAAGSAASMGNWNDLASVGLPDVMQASPYLDENSNGVYLSDLWHYTQDYSISGGSVIPRVPVVPQTSAPRAAAGTGANPLYYSALPGGGADPYVVEVNAGVDLVWANMPGCSVTDGRIDLPITGGANWYYGSGYLGWSAVAIAFSNVLNTTLRGGPHYIDMSGGEEGQVVVLRLSNNPYWKWLRIGMNEKYAPAQPFGYRPMDSWDGYYESNPTTPLPSSYPGSNFSFVANFATEATFWWGTNVVGPAGTTGVQPVAVNTFCRICLQKSGSNWVVKYAENAWFLNTAKNDYVPQSY